MFLVGVGGNLSTLSAVRTSVLSEACEINYRMAPLAKRAVGDGRATG